MIKVVPIFAENLLSTGGKLPFITILVLTISDFLTSKYYILILTIILFILIYLYIKDKSFYKRKKDIMKLSIPVTKKIYIRLISSRFASTLSMLIGSGISVVRSLDIAAQLLDNTLIEEKLKKCTLGINNGESLSSVIKGLNVFPKLLCSMIKIGEETGSIEELLYKVSEVFEEEAYESINRATVLIEPVMICFLSIMVAIIIAATMLPMLNMMNAMGN
jgi:type IV pilus assembly protein PilC